MQLRIDTLESELEAMRRGASGAATGTHTPVGGQQSAPLPPGLNIRVDGPALAPKYAPMEAFQGGLA